MRRVRQRIWIGIAAILWLLGAATLILLVASEFRQYHLEHVAFDQKARTTNLLQVEIGHDKIAFISTVVPSNPPQIHVVQFPILFPVILFAGTGFLAFRKYQRIRNKALADKSICPQCGYDLRATPDQCPECGLTIAPELRTP
jgi:hypothetical protein